MQMSPLWRSVLRQLETSLGVWGNFNVKPCSNSAFPSPLALRGFRQTVQRAHFPPSPLHLYWLQNTLLWSLTPCQKSWKTGQQCPVVCGRAGWWQHSGQECPAGISSVPTLWAHRLSLRGAEDGLLLPLAVGLCLGRDSPVKACLWMKCYSAGEACPALWSSFQLLYKEKIVRRTVHAEHSFFLNQ